MTIPSTAPTRLPGPPEQRATRIVFLVSGLGMAAWAPLVPFAKQRAELAPSELGLLLLCLGAGSIVAMPAAGALAARFGCRRTLLPAIALMLLALPLLAVLSTGPGLGLALFMFGAGVGAIDCAMNIQAIIVERASGRTMMSGFHGLFSLGGILGAGGVSMLLGLGATPLYATLCVVVVCAVATAVAAPHLLPYGSDRTGPAFAMPSGIVLLIGILCFIVFLTEGAMLDWSAVYLVTVRDVPHAQAGLGYTVFAITMTIGRLTGDAIVRRLGARRVMQLGAVCAAAGLAIATFVPSWQAALLGFALVGTGCANIVPVLFSAVGRQRTMPESVAVPAITTLGYAGVLAGPAAIGFVAQASSLAAAFTVVAAALIGVALCAAAVQPSARP